MEEIARLKAERELLLVELEEARTRLNATFKRAADWIRRSKREREGQGTEPMHLDEEEPTIQPDETKKARRGGGGSDEE